MSRFGAYRTPVALGAVFVALLVVFAVTPDPNTRDASAVAPTADPTAGPGECVVCQTDQECGSDGQCRFIEHTPWPCVASAKFDDRADQCLPEGAPPAPVSTPAADRFPRIPRGIRDDNNNNGIDLPGIGD